MIDYNQKLSNEKETQAPSHRMSTLVLLETLIFIKIVSVTVGLPRLRNLVNVYTSSSNRNGPV